MKITRVLSVSILFILASHIRAGDAIAMGYDYNGVWTAVTYNRSSTPRGGDHYRQSAQACVFALRDLRFRAGEDLAWTKIIGKSDKTGYVTVARGHELTAGKDATAIGRGNSQAEADMKALEKLNTVTATTDQTIVYRYFSYGADSEPDRNPVKREPAKHNRKVASKN